MAGLLVTKSTNIHREISPDTLCNTGSCEFHHSTQYVVYVHRMSMETLHIKTAKHRTEFNLEPKKQNHF